MKTILFCGHQSPYGLAHTLPILKHFDVAAVVFANTARWDYFSERLRGPKFYMTRSKDLMSTFGRLVPRRLKQWLKGELRPVHEIRRILRHRNIKMWDVFDVNSSEIIARLKDFDADLFLSAAYPQIFSKRLIDLPRRGSVNFHPSLLPKYRGAHPHFWQIVHGETSGGLTAHFMTEKIDDGDILAQVVFPITGCTYSELYALLVDNTPRLVEAVSVFFENPDATRLPQREADATYFRNNREIHSRISWRWHSTQEILNLIRTETAYCFFRDKKVVLFEAVSIDSNRNLTNNVWVEEGVIVDVGSTSLYIKTKDGCLGINAIGHGRKRYSGFEWARKLNVHIGENFV